MYENLNSIPRFRLSKEDNSLNSDLELMKTRKIIFNKNKLISDESSYIEVKDYQPDHFTLEVKNTVDEQILQTMIINYPGWEASINGQKKSLSISEDEFIGVKLPRGTSMVDFRYKPLSFKIG